MTIKKVFVREGIEFKNNQTIMEYFASDDRNAGVSEQTEEILK